MMHALIHLLPSPGTLHMCSGVPRFLTTVQTKVRRMPLSCVWIASWLVSVDSGLLALNGQWSCCKKCWQYMEWFNVESMMSTNNYVILYIEEASVKTSISTESEESLHSQSWDCAYLLCSNEVDSNFAALHLPLWLSAANLRVAWPQAKAFEIVLWLMQFALGSRISSSSNALHSNWQKQKVS